MKNIFTFLVLTVALLFVPTALRAQSPNTNVTWVAVTTPGISGYDVWRAPCPGTVTGTAQNGGIASGTCSVVPAGTSPASPGTFVKLTAAPVTSVSYKDFTGTPLSGYVFAVTTVCPASTGCLSGTNQVASGESVFSTFVASVVPPAALPAAPTAPVTTVSQQ